jgi:hypothetical protein
MWKGQQVIFQIYLFLPLISFLSSSSLLYLGLWSDMLSVEFMCVSCFLYVCSPSEIVLHRKKESGNSDDVLAENNRLLKQLLQQQNELQWVVCENMKHRENMLKQMFLRHVLFQTVLYRKIKDTCSLLGQVYEHQKQLQQEQHQKITDMHSLLKQVQLDLAMIEKVVCHNKCVSHIMTC